MLRARREGRGSTRVEVGFVAATGRDAPVPLVLAPDRLPAVSTALSAKSGETCVTQSDGRSGRRYIQDGRGTGGERSVNVSFYGVRGSTPCSCARNLRYGGNTACVGIDAPGVEPVVLDLGTGLRFFGDLQPADGSFRGHALVTHLHWDHVQGLPFFVPIHHAGARLDVYGPVEDGVGLAEAFDDFMRHPYFPVGIAELAGDIEFHDIEHGVHDIAGATVTAARVPHIGPTFGFRVEADGVSVAYVPDHQQPLDGSLGVDPGVVELCRGVDLLIHDAQFTAEEFAAKPHWGHCTVEYALAVAAEAGVRRLALFHHDPNHDDPTLDRIVDELRDHPLAQGVEEIVAAHEGLTLALSPAPAPART